MTRGLTSADGAIGQVGARIGLRDTGCHEDADAVETVLVADGLDDGAHARPLDHETSLLLCSPGGSGFPCLPALQSGKEAAGALDNTISLLRTIFDHVQVNSSARRPLKNNSKM